MAVPILDHLERPAAAVAVTYPVGTPDVKVDALIRALLEVSDKVAAKMYRNRKK